MEQKYIQTAIDYKKNVAGKFMLVEGAKLKQRIDGERFCVTRKIDGHMQVVFYVDGQVFMLNASGKERAKDLKCLDVFAEAVKAAGETETGMTVHWVTPVCDGGDIIAQYKVALSPIDTPDDIAAKEHVLEMKYFPLVIEKVLHEVFA